MLKDLARTRIGVTIAGLAIAVVLYFFPEAKPIACGAGFTLPFMLGGE